jgi:DNA-binding protein YbaB
VFSAEQLAQLKQLQENCRKAQESGDDRQREGSAGSGVMDEPF